MANKGEYRIGVLLPEMLLQMFNNKWISAYVLGRNDNGTIYAFMEPMIDCNEEKIAYVEFDPDEEVEVPLLTNVLKLAIVDKNPGWKPPVQQIYPEATDDEEE